MRALRVLRVVAIVVVGLAALCAAALGVLLSVDLSDYRGFIQARVGDALGRQVTFAGRLEVAPALYPTLSVEDVAIANPPWAAEPRLAQARRLTVQLALLPLLQRRLEIRQVVLEGARVHLEAHRDGRVNWLLPLGNAPAAVSPRAAPGDEPSGPAAVGAPPLEALPRIEVRDAMVSSFSHRSGVRVAFTIHKALLSAPRDRPVQLAVDGEYRGRALAFGVHGGSLGLLLAGDAPWPVRIGARSGSLSFQAQGTFRHSPDLRFDLMTVLQGEQLTELNLVLPAPVPPLGPFDLTARLVKEARGYRAEDISGTLGRRDSGHHFDLRTGMVQAPYEEALRATAAGRFRGVPFRAEAQGEPFPVLLRGARPWAGRATLQLVETHLRVEGQLTGAPRRDFAVALDAAGPSLSALDGLLGRRLPALGPYTLQAHLRRSGGTYRVRNLAARVGRSDVSGELTVEPAAHPLRVRGALSAEVLRLADFAAAWAEAPLPQAGRSVPLVRRLLPAGLLRRAQGQLRLRVGSIPDAPEPLQDVAITARLAAGTLELAPLALRLAAQPLTGRLRVATNAPEPRVTLEARGQDVDYGRLLRALRLTERVAGRAEALTFTLRGQGHTLAAWWHDAALTLAARQGVLHVRGAEGAAGVRVAVQRGTASGGGGEGLRITARGRFRDRPYNLQLQGNGIPGLTDGAQPWRVAVHGTVAGAAVGLRGTVDDVWGGSGADLRVSVAGEALPALAPVIGHALPAWGPYRATGRLRDRPGGLRITDLRLAVGESDLAGALAVRRQAERWRVTGRLAAERLRADDLLPAAESAPGAAAGDGDGRIVPALRIPRDALLGLDLRLAMQARRLEVGHVALNEARLEVRHRDGHLTLAPLAARLLGGTVTGTVSLNTASDPPTGTLSLKAHRLNYTEALATRQTGTIEQGTIDFAAELKARGATLRDAVANAEGRVEVLGGSGYIDSGYLNLWATDLLGALLPSFGDDERAHLRCVMGRFDFAEGQATSRSILLDFDHVLVKGNGTIHLDSEALDLLLWPEPREVSLINVTTPVVVGGTLAQPQVSPQAGGLIQDVAWWLIGANNPLVLLFGVVRPGLVEDTPCREALTGAGEVAALPEHEPPTPFSKAADFFRGLGRLLGDGTLPEEEQSD